MGCLREPRHDMNRNEIYELLEFRALQLNEICNHTSSSSFLLGASFGFWYILHGWSKKDGENET